MSIILGHGIYSLPEAARLTRLRSSRVREWFTGRSGLARKAVFESDYDSVGGDRAISFLDLIIYSSPASCGNKVFPSNCSGKFEVGFKKIWALRIPFVDARS
jgi:hypothetical protein